MLVTLLRGTARRSALRTLSTAPQFDEAMAKAYNIVAENHRHADGPWSRMRDKVIEAVDGRAGCTILDLASGPGEPAATIAEALPDAVVLATDVASRASALPLAQGRRFAFGVQHQTARDHRFQSKPKRRKDL